MQDNGDWRAATLRAMREAMGMGMGVCADVLAGRTGRDVTRFDVDDWESGAAEAPPDALAAMGDEWDVFVGQVGAALTAAGELLQRGNQRTPRVRLTYYRTRDEWLADGGDGAQDHTEQNAVNAAAAVSLTAMGWAVSWEYPGARRP